MGKAKHCSRPYSARFSRYGGGIDFDAAKEAALKAKRVPIDARYPTGQIYADPLELLPRDGHAEFTGGHMHEVACSSCAMVVRPFVARLVMVEEGEGKGAGASKKKGSRCSHTHIGCASSAQLIQLLTHYGAKSLEGVPGFSKAPNRPFIARSLAPLVTHLQTDLKKQMNKAEIATEIKAPSVSGKKKETKQTEKKEPKQAEEIKTEYKSGATA